MIYFAVDDEGVALAICMAKHMAWDTWEICKLGSNKNMSHKGAAFHIYEKHGFKEIKLDDYEYERGDIAFEKILV